MAKREQLLVRNLDPDVVEALRARAARHGRSVEAEHRNLLHAVLVRRPRSSFKALLLAIPKSDSDPDEDFVFDRGELRDVEL